MKRGRARIAAPIRYPDARQSALDTSSHNARACPTCGRDWEGIAVKVCWRCGETIRRADRHRVVPCGPGVFRYEHATCGRAK
ncbi:MAG: hypothetical protein E6Q97_23465 [Desulfurellales bacterium]|nr:MAG: hypothetical protein E6Q97_23465 [Desulfurellales bacterium]